MLEIRDNGLWEQFAPWSVEILSHDYSFYIIKSHIDHLRYYKNLEY